MMELFWGKLTNKVESVRDILLFSCVYLRPPVKSSWSVIWKVPWAKTAQILFLAVPSTFE